MRALLIVAGMAAAVALVSGVILLRGEAASRAERQAAREEGGAEVSRTLLRETVRDRDVAHRRLEEMERRLDELTSEVEMLREWASLPAVAEPGTQAGALPGMVEEGNSGEAPSGSGTASSGETFETESGGAPANTDKARMAASRKAAARALKEARREADLLGRVERASKAMNLIPAEKQRLEEIVRGHLERVDELGSRAKTAMKDSGFGLSPADKATLDQFSRDRRVVDKQLQKDVVSLVGPERYKQYQRALRDQRNKEKALKRISRSW
ncbi:MAG: hypothetical protein ACYTDX_02780 [Planctomycetota bacterium]|jgi:hypothetical protein